MYNVVIVGNGSWAQIYKSTIQKSFPNINLISANRPNWKSQIDNKPDGIIVCTPPQSHIEISSYALEKSIPVMCEKPLSLSLKEAEILKQYNAPILVNHIHLFSSQYQKLKHDINNHNLNYIRTIGQGNTQRDYNQLWDYGPHDISMILDLSTQYPKDVKCDKINDGCYGITLEFDHFSSHSIVGLGAKKRSFITSTNYGIFEYSDRFPINDLPLTNAIQVLIDTLDGKKDYRLGLDLSLNVLRVLENCEKDLLKKQS
jgi:hypothetical protein